MLIFTEIIPRAYAKNNVSKLSGALIVPLNTLRIILRPFTLIFLEISKFILKLFKVKLEDKMFELTEEDIKIFVKEGTESGAIEEGEEEMHDEEEAKVEQKEETPIGDYQPEEEEEEEMTLEQINLYFKDHQLIEEEEIHDD